MSRAVRARRRTGDAGQAFPLYITAVAALLFLALAFFAVGRAGATRNGAQTAADAAALAAAQDYRDQLLTGFLAALGPRTGTGGGWQDWLAGLGADRGTACRAAASYAGLNGAQPGLTCDQGEEPGSFRVTVTSEKTVGRSVVPGTENRHAKASAKAVVAPRCMPGAQPTPTPTPPPSSPAPPSATPGPQPSGPDAGQSAAVTLLCDGKALTVDPRLPGAAVRAADLFAVHLTD